MPDPTAPSSEHLLHVSGTHLVDARGRTVRLTGFGLGGWMNQENFITGFPATETLERAALLKAMGQEAYDAFFDTFMEQFFTDEDAAYIASLGLNCVRIPVNYHHFEDDDDPGVLKESGFVLLDRAIDLCARHGLYSVIDLHATPGAQNQRWHSDNPTHVAGLWQHREFQDRVVRLWQAFAQRYRGNGWVAGYNPLNEPSDPSGHQLTALYQRLREAIRQIDPDHILFLDGNRQSTMFDDFAEPWENTVYTLHDYALSGFPDSGDYPGLSRGQWVDQSALEAKFLERSQYMRSSGTPIWVGEFGPVYTGDPARDDHRYRTLTDQLALYDRYDAGWSLWTYKDIGLQGIRCTGGDSPYNRLIEPVTRKKAWLGVDSWGSTDQGVRHLIDPIDQMMAQEFPDFDPVPFGRRSYIDTLIRHIMFAEPLVDQFAQLFAGLTPVQAADLARCFAFSRTQERTRLAEILRSATGASAPRLDPAGAV